MTGVLRCLSVHSVKGGVGKSTVATLGGALARAAVAFRAGVPHRHGSDRYQPRRCIAAGSTALALAVMSCLSRQRCPPTSGIAGDLSRSHRAKRDLFGCPSCAVPQRLPALCHPRLVRRGRYARRGRGAGDSPAARPTSGSCPARPCRPTSNAPWPVIFDEQHSAYLEGRLERFLSGLCQATQSEIEVVFDVPPTIPGPLARGAEPRLASWGGVTEAAAGHVMAISLRRSLTARSARVP
jgi:hypothetical protein